MFLMPKEMDISLLEIVCLMKEKDMKFKAFHITYMVSVPTLGIIFHIEDMDAANDTVNIFL